LVYPPEFLISTAEQRAGGFGSLSEDLGSLSGGLAGGGGGGSHPSSEQPRLSEDLGSLSGGLTGGGGGGSHVSSGQRRLLGGWGWGSWPSQLREERAGPYGSHANSLAGGGGAGFCALGESEQQQQGWGWGSWPSQLREQGGGVTSTPVQQPLSQGGWGSLDSLARGAGGGGGVSPNPAQQQRSQEGRGSFDSLARYAGGGGGVTPNPAQQRSQGWGWWGSWLNRSVPDETDTHGRGGNTGGGHTRGDNTGGGHTPGGNTGGGYTRGDNTGGDHTPGGYTGGDSYLSLASKPPTVSMSRRGSHPNLHGSSAHDWHTSESYASLASAAHGHGSAHRVHPQVQIIHVYLSIYVSIDIGRYIYLRTGWQTSESYALWPHTDTDLHTVSIHRYRLSIALSIHRSMFNLQRLSVLSKAGVRVNPSLQLR